MKPLKKAAQKNVQVNKEFYTADIADLLEIPGVFDLSGVSADEGDYRVALSRVKDLKVVLADYGYYTTVAVMESGETIFVSL